MLLIQTEVLVTGEQKVPAVHCRRNFNIHIYCLNYKRGRIAKKIILLLLLLPLALQPAVGFGLSNNTSQFFPIYHQLSPSSHCQHLKNSFYFLLNFIHSTSRAGRLLAITKIYTQSFSVQYHYIYPAYSFAQRS